MRTIFTNYLENVNPENKLVAIPSNRCDRDPFSTTLSNTTDLNETYLFHIKKIIILFLCLSIFQFQASHAQNNVEIKDQYGRPLLSKDNKRINYSYQESLLLDTPLEIKSIRKLQDQEDQIMDCEYGFTQTTLGNCIGGHAMIHEDIDNDGDVDLIVSAIVTGYYSGSYWYVLEYDEETEEYYQSHVNSHSLNLEESIEAMNVYDRDNDGIKEIFEITNQHLNVYSSITFELIQSIEIDSDSYEDIGSIEFCNVDTDPDVEIIFCNEHKTFLYTLDDLTLKREFDFNADYLKAGDVDGDGINEIVYSNGDIVQLGPLSEELEWNFSGDSNYQGYIELSDVDEDGMLEIAYAEYWHNIKIVDADIQSYKFEINVSSDIDALTMFDVNNDGVDELIYGDGQWGEIHCLNSITGIEMWSIDKEEHGTTDVGVADIDKDGDLEIFWASGCSSSGSDYLFVHDLSTHDFEYQSKYISGPFRAIEIADLDGDGINEIITISHESGNGNDSGILSVFNSETEDLIFQSDGSYFGTTWMGIPAVKVADVDNDQQMELIVAAGRTYSGRIWIIDGQDFSIQSEQIFGYGNGDISEFKCFDLGDVDQDGIIEIMASSDGNLYQISTEDLTVEWSDEQSGATISNVVVEDLNNDGLLEVITCANNIRVYNGQTHEKWITPISDFRNFDILDWDNDGLKDIIAVNYYGDISMFNAYSDERTVLLETNMDNIYCIKAGNLISEATTELVYSNNGYLYISSPNGKTYRSKKLGKEVGKFDGLQIVDKDNDGTKEIFAGTTYQVIEFPQSCFQCVDFTLGLEASDLSCLPANDGSIETITIGGLAPYSFSWDNGSDQQNLYNLEPGTYTISVTDIRGCEYEKTDSVSQSVLISTALKSNVGCNGEDNGIIEILISEGHPPYNYNWSNGNNTSFQENLAIGNYQITVSDLKHCEEIYEIEIEQGEVEFGLHIEDITCNGDENASAQVYSFNGTSPFEIEWSNGSDNQHVYDLGIGDYSVTITDYLDCSLTKTFNISEPDSIQLFGSTTIDDPSTPQFEGTATVYAVGGEPPYSYRWNDAFYQTGQTAYNLPLGEVSVRVTDARGCSAFHTAHIWTGIEDHLKNKIQVSIYPNPVNNQIFIDFENNINLNTNEINIYDELGREITLADSDFHKISNKRYWLDLTKLKKGLYFIKIKNDIQYNAIKFFKN